ncbi:MAG TPA: endonuclease V [Actinomycetota bacterium]|nr:endonuclease V [Actinomycetota bacterium]
MVVAWPSTREGLADLQRRLAAEAAEAWHPPLGREIAIGAVFAAFSTRADPSPSERAWVAAVAGAERHTIVVAAEAPYEPGYLALREGPELERAIRGLTRAPDVLLVDATGRDHPRGAGLALHLGAVLEMPTVGVTDRPLLARIDAEGRLLLDGREVGRAVVTLSGARPVCVHAGWRTDVDTAVAVVRSAGGRARTPEPLRRARFLARSARARDEGRLPPGWRMDEPLPPRSLSR